jgi:hypothetical protein
MKITIVYESMFGNTHKVAEAIRDGAREALPNGEVQCLPVHEVAPDAAATSEVLVLGGPTHIRGMTSPRSRKMGAAAAEKQATSGEAKHVSELEAEGPGIRDGLRACPRLTVDGARPPLTRGCRTGSRAAPRTASREDYAGTGTS